MVGLLCSILESCLNVLVFQIGVIPKYFFRARARAQQSQNVTYPNAHPPNAGAAPTLSVIDGESLMVMQLR